MLQESVENILDTETTSALRPGKLLLQIGLPAEKPSERGPKPSCPTINIERICDMLSGGPDEPNRVYPPHFSVTPAHNSSGVGWAFTAISVTTAQGEKGKRMMIPMQAGDDSKTYT